MTTASGFTSHESKAYDNLFSGDFPRVEQIVTITGGAALARGAVLGQITGGDYQLSASAAGDGSEVPEAILGEAADTTGGDVQALIYEAGHFNELVLSFGAGHTAATVRSDLRGKSIFMGKNLAA